MFSRQMARLNDPFCKLFTHPWEHRTIFVFFPVHNVLKSLSNWLVVKNEKGVTKNRKERKDLLMQSHISEILGTCQQPHVGFGEL